MSTKSYRLDTSQPPQVINKNEPIDSHQLIDSLPSSWIPRLQDSPSQHPAKSDRNPSSMPPADGIFWDFTFFLFKVRWSGRSGSTENQHNKFIVIIHTVQMLKYLFSSQKDLCVTNCDRFKGSKCPPSFLRAINRGKQLMVKRCSSQGSFGVLKPTLGGNDGWPWQGCGSVRFCGSSRHSACQKYPKISKKQIPP